MKKVALLILLALMAGCSRDPKVERDKYFASGQKYLESKKYEEATIEFRNALRLDKGHIPSYLGIAKAFQAMGNYQDAISAYQDVVRLDSRNVESRLRIGDYLLAAGTRDPAFFKKAQQMAEEALQAEPSNVDALILLGSAYSGQNEPDKSIQQLEKALSLDPNNLRAMLNLAAAQFRKGNDEEAESTFKNALQKHPKDIQPLLAIAAFYTATRRPLDAENSLKSAFDRDPSDSRCLYALVSFYMSAKKEGEAENVLKEAILRRPNEREPRWGLAGFYVQKGRLNEAMETLNALLKMNPRDPQVLLRIAEISLSQNNDAKAEENIRAILAVNNKDAGAHFLQGRIFRRRSETDKAMTEFETAIKIDAGLLPAYLEKADLLLMRGDLDASESTLKETLQRNRNYLPARGAYAKLLAVRQRPQEALQQSQEVLAVFPNSEDALGARGDAFRMLGRLEDSRKDWLRLCEMQPRNPLYWYRLGYVEVMQGNGSAALRDLRRALEIHPAYTAAINDILYLLLKDKKYDAAFAELDRLAMLSSPQDEIRRFRGQVFLSKGDFAAAESEFRKAIEINSKNYQAYMQLAQLNKQRNNLPQAIREVDQLIARNDKLAVAYLMKANYLQLSNDIEDAKTAYRKTLALDSNNALAANNLAWLLCEGSGNLEEALSLARSAKKKMPDDPEIAETLGWIYYKMKNYTLAVDQLLFSVNSRKQPSAENYYRLGVAYYGKGDLLTAKQTLRKSLELSASFPGADEARKILKQSS